MGERQVERMYESYETLKIKKKAGIESAVQELQFRKQNRETLPLRGLRNLAVVMVRTEEMQRRIRSIDSLYQRVGSGRKVKDIILLDAFHSATIEGARTTVEHIRKSYEKPKTKDDKMVINTIHGMNYAYENKITMENIRTLWEIVTKDVCENGHLAGTQFRTGMVYVGSNTAIIHTPAAPGEIAGMMEELFAFADSSDLPVWLTAGILHFYFVYIHPFCDGNGRMARILTQSFLKQNGMDKIRYLPLSRTINDHLSGYYAYLKQAELVQANGKRWMDITPFLDYMLHIVEECMVTSIQEDRRLSESQQMVLVKMQKRGKGAEITIETAAKILKVSHQTAGRVLNGLASMGYLDKIKRDRKNIYRLL